MYGNASRKELYVLFLYTYSIQKIPMFDKPIQKTHFTLPPYCVG